ncbi:MAG: hypothetical protein R3B70_35880 [Polyangiaceae bacterium]
MPDDLEECTTDACVEGEEQHTPNNGTTCGVNKDLTCEAGKCKCQTASQCGEDTACLTFECNGVCVANQADGTIVPGGVEGDCQKTVCQGGKVATAVDEADFPLDSVLGDCKKPSCNANGELVTVPEMTDVPPDETQGIASNRRATHQAVRQRRQPGRAPLDDSNPAPKRVRGWDRDRLPAGRNGLRGDRQVRFEQHRVFGGLGGGSGRGLCGADVDIDTQPVRLQRGQVSYELHDLERLHRQLDMRRQ